MSKVKGQHIVPRSYLKHFAQDEKVIHVFDIQSNSQFHTSPDAIAKRRYFYDNESPLNENQKLEKKLSNLEGQFATMHNKLVDGLLNNVVALNEDDKILMAKYIFSQQGRTSTNRIVNNQIQDAINEFLLSKGVKSTEQIKAKD